MPDHLDRKPEKETVELVTRLNDVAVWSAFLGSAAYIGVWLERVSPDFSTTVTGYMALGGLTVAILRWLIVDVKRKHDEK